MNINEISTSYILDLILDDLNGYIESGSREYLFEEINGTENMLSKWLNQFVDFPEGFSKEEIQFIQQEIGEYMGGIMNIWTNEEDERIEFIKKITKYFGENKGFCKMVLDVYKIMSKEYWAY